MWPADVFVYISINPLTAFNFQWAGLGVQREAAEVHIAHGSDCDSTVKKKEKRKQYIDSLVNL